MSEHSRFPKPRWRFGHSPPTAEPQPTWTKGDSEHPPWLTYGDVKMQVEAEGEALEIARNVLDAAERYGVYDREMMVLAEAVVRRASVDK